MSYTHPILGILEVKGKEYLYDTKSGSNEIGGYIMRETGLQKEIELQDKYIKALADPGTYLAVVNDDLKRIGKILEKVYTDETLRLLTNGYSNDEAEKGAKKEMEHMKQRLMEQHAKDYPKGVKDTVVEKLKKK